jgi:hypoxanthine phosphoribosyltransferase
VLLKTRDETDVKLPNWFDEQLRAELVKKANRKYGLLSFVDSIAFAVLDRAFGNDKWRFKKAHSWRDLEQCIELDCREIRDANFEPDLIVGVKSGGAFIANYVAACLDTSQVEYINVDRYSPVLGSAFLAVVLKYFRRARLVTSFDVDLTGQRVLIVDDQTRTGKSLNMARQWVEHNGAADVKTYCVFTQGAVTDFGNREGIMMNSPWGDDP